MRNIANTLALGLCLAWLSGCALSSLEKREWFEVQTEHFEIVSSLSREETELLARNAELFHSAAEFVMRTKLPTPPVPTRVVAFDGRGIRRPFAVRGAASFFRPNIRESLLILRTGGGWRDDATPEVRHEYMHYLLESHGGFGKHLWFDEGFAQLMSTVDARGDHVDLGHFRADYLYKLKTEPWIPLSKVLRTQDLEDFGARKRPLFYAESWALVHYIYLGQDHPDRGYQQLQRYFAEIEKGYSYERAVREAFGRSISDLDKDLHKYVRADRFDAIGVRFRKKLAVRPELATPEKHQTFTTLGWVLLELERAGDAQKWFERALGSDPNAARAHAGLGRVEGMREQWEAALGHLERAIELEPNEVLNRIDLGIHYRDHAAASEDADERSELLGKAREQLRKALELDDSLPETYAVYGQSFLVAGEDPAGGLASLERAHSMVPTDEGVELDLARMYFELGRNGEARRLALEAHANTHSKPVRVQAEELLQAIDSAIEAGAPS